MAAYLAEGLNALDRREPLPPFGAQHHPVRFQLVHDPHGFSTAVGVVYIHGTSQRMVAIAPTDELASSIASILNHVGYPMFESPGLIFGRAEPAEIEPAPEKLPEPTTLQRRASRSQRRLAVYSFASLLPTAMVWGLAAVIDWPFAVVVILVSTLVVAIVWLRLGR
jgi:hypothetical protein